MKNKDNLNSEITDEEYFEILRDIKKIEPQIDKMLNDGSCSYCGSKAIRGKHYCLKCEVLVKQ